MLTTALRVSESFLVHGLDADLGNVERTRARIDAMGLYGPVSADQLRTSHLPYTDNTVNLLVSGPGTNVPRDEVERVLCPEGVAVTLDAQHAIRDTWRKPRPAGIDDWTHYLHSPNGNAVSKDSEIGFLRRLQWIGGPRYGRHHDHMSSASAMVTANGRLFYIFDHTSPLSIQLPSTWQLVARDAFNGTVLWRRDMGTWFSQMQRLKSGPSNLPRRLVAAGQTVYVTLALNAPVTALNAATGTTVKTYEQTQGADEILFVDDVLYLVVNRKGHGRKPVKAWTPQERIVMAVKADTGETLWEKAWPWVVPGCMAVADKRVVFFDGQNVTGLDASTGAELWKTEVLGKQTSLVPIYFSPCLVLYENLVLFSGSAPDTKAYHADNGPSMYAFSAETGRTLWKAPHAPSGYRSAEDLLVLDGLVWTSDIFNSKEFRTEQTGTVWGRDPRTGELKVEFKPDVDTHWFHHRCYRAKATEKYLLTSRTGIEFVDVRKKHWTCHHWARGACLYGIMPGNGMIYSPPHPCACYLEAKLYGFNALAARSEARQKVIDRAGQSERLEKGPAYAADPAVPDLGAPTGADWPTLRADAARSGRVDAQISTRLATAWSTPLGGRLSSPVVAGGRLFVAAIDSHRVHALAAETGSQLWHFTAGARVDSPPAVWQGRVLFGSRDGYVYCLRADDGRLIWRYRAAPADLRMGAFGQLESVWPVHGAVLIHETAPDKTELWCVAGRSMFLDGGLRLLRLDPVTGGRIGEKILDDRVPNTEDNLQVQIAGLNMPVALPDVLVRDGASVYMKSQQFDMAGNRLDIDTPNKPARQQKGDTAHLFCPTGLLDDIWWHRSYWVFGRVWKSGAGGYYQPGRFAPSGRPMVFDDDRVYGFGRKPEYYRWTTPMEYVLFAAAKQPQVLRFGDADARRGKGKKKKGGLGGMPPNTFKKDWTQDVPILVRAMVLAGKTLFIAGPRDLIDEKKTLRSIDTQETQDLLARQSEVIKGSEGALLRAVSTADGSTIAEQQLDTLPVFDGMIAAGTRIYYTTVDGAVVALGAPQ